MEVPAGNATVSAVLPQLQLWLDPVQSDGPENMALDQWLAETCDAPVLRRYRWTPGGGSFGYCVKTADLPASGLKWVRRWTGGGIVDHRADWTYTLFVPRGWIQRDIFDLLEEKRQLIFYGPPGTGKTYVAQRIAASDGLVW